MDTITAAVLVLELRLLAAHPTTATPAQIRDLATRAADALTRNNPASIPPAS